MDEWDEVADIADHLGNLYIAGVVVQRVAANAYSTFVLIQGGSVWMLACRPSRETGLAAVLHLLRGLATLRAGTIALHPWGPEPDPHANLAAAREARQFVAENTPERFKKLFLPGPVSG